MSFVSILRLVLISCSTATLAGACGGSGEREGSGFIDAYARVWCERTTPCCDARGVTNDVARCEQTMSGLLGLATGNYHADKATECLEGMKTWDCTTTAPSACGSVFKIDNPHPLGGRCTMSTDCVDSDEGRVTCVFGSDSSTGTCKVKVRPAAGQPCSAGATTETHMYDCTLDPKLYCDYSTDTCKTYATLGEPCETTECDQDSFCDDTTLRCEALTPVGGDCVDSSRCINGGRCDDATGKCVARGAGGDPCEEPDDCASAACDTMNHVCVSLTGPGAGACLNTL